MKSLLFAILIVGFSAFYAHAQSSTSTSATKDQPVELGDVNWLRDLDSAVSSSKEKDKPIAILFQEVPG